MPIDLNELRDEIHAANVQAGWWDDKPEGIEYIKAQLIITEIVEATEGARKDLMDDHLPHRKMEEVELADAMIRALDLGGYLRLRYLPCDTNVLFDRLNSAMQPAHMHMILSAQVWDVAECESNRFYSQLLDAIMKVAQLRGFDLFGALREKLEYNKTRADHKRENRAADGGKKF